MNIDVFTLHCVVSYCDIDTKYMLRTLSKSFNDIKILCEYESEYYSPPWCKILVGASYHGSLKLVRRELPKFCDDVMNYREALSESLTYACLGGHLPIVKYLFTLNVRNILQDCDLYRGLYKACYSGHKDVIEYMFIHGIPDADGGMYYACEGGQLDIIELMISKGVGIEDSTPRASARGATRFNDGLRHACMGCCIEAVKLMIQKLKQNKQEIFWSWGLTEACRELRNYKSNTKEHSDIIKLLINECVKNGDTITCYNCSRTMEEHMRICSLPDYGERESSYRRINT